MSKENIELNDEALEKVTGGSNEGIPVDVQIYGQGSVFVPKQETNFIIVLLTSINTMEYYDNPNVSIVRFDQLDGDKRWNNGGYLIITMQALFDSYQYSAELTTELSGKLNY